MKIFVSNSTHSDLAGIKEYYTDEGVPHIGNQFVTAIIKHLQILKDNPNIGRVVPEFEDERIRVLESVLVSFNRCGKRKDRSVVTALQSRKTTQFTEIYDAGGLCEESSIKCKYLIH